MKEAIIIENVWKSYKRGVVRQGDLRSTLKNAWSTVGQKTEEFYALQDISLTISQGDILGIVGPNGAGKSTLLKLLSRITFPTRGRLIIHGTLSSMLEVGTGFHPELTGIENIFLNGSILGMNRKEVNSKLESIIDFAGLEDFIKTPVKHYSSGMYVRLAFAVASHLTSDIILIDEILGTGDQEFRKKCLDKLLSASKEGRTAVIVSHQMSYLRTYCNTGIYIKDGRVHFRGTIEDTIADYISSHTNAHSEPIQNRRDRKGDGRCKIISLKLLDHDGHECIILHSGQELNFQIILQSSSDILPNPEVRIDCLDQFGQQWFVLNNTVSGTTGNFYPAKQVMTCTIKKLPLNEGYFSFDISVFVDNKLSDYVPFAMQAKVEKGIFYNTGKLPLPSKGLLVDYSWDVTNQPI